MKLAVVGAGSTYTPELVSGLVRERDRLDVGELVLHDIDRERREVVGGLARRILERQGYAGELRLTDDLDRTLDGAGAVLVQIRVGGQAARLRDETIPAACGCVGQETTGAGGLAKAWRTVPIVLDIAARARELAADDAWIIDFTNPVGIVTRSLLDEGHRAVGLCNVAITMQRRIAGLLGVSAERVRVDQVGLNHLTWIRAVYLDGRDVLGEVLTSRGEALAHEVGLPTQLMERLGAIPSYYLRYFYAEREVLAEQRMTPPRAQTVADIERRLLELYRDPALSEKPALLDQRGGAYYSEAAIQLLASLGTDGDDVQVVDVRNNGTLAGLADDDVVEVPARIRSSGPVPLPQDPLAPELLGLVAHVAAYERLAATAATRGDLEAARLALLTHPLVRDWRLADSFLGDLVLVRGEGASTPRRIPKPNATAWERSERIVLAVDGGAVKTDLALVNTSGKLLALARGSGSSPHYIGLDGCVALLGRLLAEAVACAGLPPNRRPPADSAKLMVAGADLPKERDALRRRIERLGWAERLAVDNDTLALLRSGTERGWGVAVVCGSGINCIGITPDGRQVRFPSLGEITGDWGGGSDVGLAALMAAARSADGRGPRTILETAVPAHFGMTQPFDVGRAVHLREISSERLGELSRVVFTAADDGDSVAAGIVRRLADEVVTFATAAMRRLDLLDESPDVVLGGGLMRAASPDVIARIASGVQEVASRAKVIAVKTGPIVGAALLGLDEMGAGVAAGERVRIELGNALTSVEHAGAYPTDGRAVVVGGDGGPVSQTSRSWSGPPQTD
jgi:6-phospho-beta-glucosidase